MGALGQCQEAWGGTRSAVQWQQAWDSGVRQNSPGNSPGRLEACKYFMPDLLILRVLRFTEKRLVLRVMFLFLEKRIFLFANM